MTEISIQEKKQGVEIDQVSMSNPGDISVDCSSMEQGKTVKERAPVISSEEKKLVKKINIAFVPLVCAILFVQFVDKTTLSYAAIYGIYEDTGISQTQFSWLGSLFYLGYLAVQVPNQYLMQRLPISKYLGSILVIWGVCLLCMAFTHRFSDLGALRFLLGFWEGTTYACIFLLISTLYRRREQVTWFGTMFICNATSIALGAIISYGIGYMDGLAGMKPWKWCMIIWGAITIILGVTFFLFLPDTPTSRWFRIKPEEEIIIEERSKDNAVVRNKAVKMSHIKEALTEPRFYCYFFMSLLINLQNGAITLFNSQITVSMGFDRLTSVLLNIPNGATVIICLGICMYLSKRLDEVNYIGTLAGLITMVGVILLVSLPLGPAQLIGLYLCGATSPPYVMLQTSISSNVSGYTKKIFYTAANIVGYSIGNFAGSLIMVEKYAPRYVPSMIVYAIADLLVALLFVYLRISFARENKRRQALKDEGKIPAPPPNREELDLTDKEDLNFVYRP
ncbi:mfs allantoate [Lichtheimia corymbifera JMRC:FSU:9682]|uniref:Mfs allantoate n=1 Tax=Lichtheimia corymbifera JMRC:FSU:9682 TaxID=1263082 RepID=A0A068RM29_9FUNG|nr:mfs allantoate [Lichtheimia corymbifera JMRC:FSU:9682]